MGFLMLKRGEYIQPTSMIVIVTMMASAMEMKFTFMAQIPTTGILITM